MDFYSTFLAFPFRFLSLDDLVQECNLALWKEIKDFPHCLPAAFFAYAAAVIRSALLQARCRDQAIYVPHAAVHHLTKAGRIKEIDHLQPVSLDIPAQQRDLAEMKEQHPHTSARVHARTIGDLLQAPLRTGEDSQIEKQKAEVSRLLACLTEQQRQVMRLRYGLDETDGHMHTIEEIAAKLDRCSTTIRLAERTALNKLRLACSDCSPIAA